MNRVPLEIATNGVRLAGFLVYPFTGALRKRTLLLFCHGLPATVPASSVDSGYEALLRRFAARGYPALFFNFRGTGESGGDFSIAGWAEDLREILGVLEREYLSARGNRVVIVASSAGAAVALHVAAGDSRIAGVCALAAPADFGILDGADPETWAGHFRTLGLIRSEGFPANPRDWFVEFGRISPLPRMTGLADRPVLLVHGEADSTVPVAHAERLAAAMGPRARLVRIPGAGHRLRLEERAIAAVETWLSEFFPD